MFCLDVFRGFSGNLERSVYGEVTSVMPNRDLFMTLNKTMLYACFVDFDLFLISLVIRPERVYSVPCTQDVQKVRNQEELHCIYSKCVYIVSGMCSTAVSFFFPRGFLSPYLDRRENFPLS